MSTGTAPEPVPSSGPASIPGGVPVAPLLSLFDPLFIGIDEFGQAITLDLVFHNLLAAGEPGSGKSGLLNTITATGAMATNTRLVLFDGKLVELGPWRDIADEFVTTDMDHALSVLRRLLVVARNRYAWILSKRGRKVSRDTRLTVILTVIDELAMFSTVYGTKQQQDEFANLLRGLVALGRACGMPVVAAAQRPSWDIIPASLRDLFGYRAAFRCTTTSSSDIILGQGWAELGYNARDIDPSTPGVCQLLAETGQPRKVKVAYLSDEQIYSIADYTAWMRRTNNLAA